MAITQAMCTSFKKELLEAKHNFLNTGGNTFKIALYTSSATMNAATTAYSATNEISNDAGSAYDAEGASLTRVDPSSSGTTGFTDFANISWTTATFTARGALIYNETTPGDPAVIVLDFGANKTATAGTFSIAFPTANASNAIIRIA